MGAGVPANTGGAGAIHRVGRFAGTPAPTREGDTLSNIVPCATAQSQGLGNLSQGQRWHRAWRSDWSAERQFKVGLDHGRADSSYDNVCMERDKMLLPVLGSVRNPEKLKRRPSEA